MYPRHNRSPLVGHDVKKIPVRVTAPRFELVSQRQKVSRLPNEPPGRPVPLSNFNTGVCVSENEDVCDVCLTVCNDAICVCVCDVIPFILEVRLVDVPAGVTQEEGHTGFLIHLPFAVLALIFVARRIQPSLSLWSTVKSNFVY